MYQIECADEYSIGPGKWKWRQLAKYKRENCIWLWRCQKATYSPSLKYSLSVVLNFFENLTNSFLRCSTDCLPEAPGIKPTTSLTASSNFLMALAISLQYAEHWISMKTKHEDSLKANHNWNKTHLMVSKNVFRSLISSGIRLKIRFNDADFLFNSWNASSDRFSRYSITENVKIVDNVRLVLIWDR